MKKEDFKVYSNPDIRKLMKEKEEEITFDLEIPDEDTITMLFLSCPYFPLLIRNQEALYYPVDLTAEESLLAPFRSKEVFWDFIESTKLIRLKEKILLGPLLHIAGEDEQGVMHMCSLFDGPVQIEFAKFFKTVVMAINIEEALEEEFDDVFEQLMEGLEDNGYLDQVMMNIATFMDDPEVLSDLLFPELEEEESI